MRAEFYKKHAEDILSNLESIRATFKELVDSNKIAPKSYKDSTICLLSNTISIALFFITL